MTFTEYSHRTSKRLEAEKNQPLVMHMSFTVTGYSVHYSWQHSLYSNSKPPFLTESRRNELSHGHSPSTPSDFGPGCFWLKVRNIRDPSPPCWCYKQCLHRGVRDLGSGLHSPLLTSWGPELTPDPSGLGGSAPGMQAWICGHRAAPTWLSGLNYLLGIACHQDLYLKPGVSS